MKPRIVYQLTGVPRRAEEADLPPRRIELTHIPLPVLQRIFHAGPANQMLERRHVNHEKADRLQAYLSERLDTHAYHWEFRGVWEDERS